MQHVPRTVLIVYADPTHLEQVRDAAKQLLEE
jgi:hypothetical protein